MKILQTVFDKIITRFDVYVFILFMMIVAFLLWVDIPRLKRGKYIRESKIAKGMAYFYLLSGVLLLVLSMLQT